MNKIKWAMHDAFMFAASIVMVVVSFVLCLLNIVSWYLFRFSGYMFFNSVNATKNCLSRYKKDYYEK